MMKQSKTLDWVIGLTVLGSLLTGVLGVVGALVLIFAEEPAGAGASLVAAGLAFGLLANAVLRD